MSEIKSGVGKAPLIIDGEVARTPLRAERCETCACAFFETGNAEMGQCRSGPPAVSIVPHPHPNMPRQIVSSSFGGWPPVRREQWCITAYQAAVKH